MRPVGASNRRPARMAVTGEAAAAPLTGNSASASNSRRARRQGDMVRLRVRAPEDARTQGTRRYLNADEMSMVLIMVYHPYAILTSAAVLTKNVGPIVGPACRRLSRPGGRLGQQEYWTPYSRPRRQESPRHTPGSRGDDAGPHL